MHRVNDTDYRRLVDRVIALAEADDRIRAAFVYGSHATGSADRFSDLDIGLVTTDDAFGIEYPKELDRLLSDRLRGLW